MQAVPDEQDQSRYLVELPRAGTGLDFPDALAARARLAAAELKREGMPVRFLRVIFVPEDETCFLLYEAASPEAAAEAAERAAIPVERVVEAVRVGEGEIHSGPAPSRKGG